MLLLLWESAAAAPKESKSELIGRKAVWVCCGIGTRQTGSWLDSVEVFELQRERARSKESDLSERRKFRSSALIKSLQLFLADRQREGEGVKESGKGECNGKFCVAWAPNGNVSCFVFVFFECNKTDCQRTIKSAKQSSSRRRRRREKEAGNSSDPRDF